MIFLRTTRFSGFSEEVVLWAICGLCGREDCWTMQPEMLNVVLEDMQQNTVCRWCGECDGGDDGEINGVVI